MWMQKKTSFVLCLAHLAGLAQCQHTGTLAQAMHTTSPNVPVQLTTNFALDEVEAVDETPAAAPVVTNAAVQLEVSEESTVLANELSQVELGDMPLAMGDYSAGYYGTSRSSEEECCYRCCNRCCSCCFGRKCCCVWFPMLVFGVGAILIYDGVRASGDTRFKLGGIGLGVCAAALCLFYCFRLR